MSRIIVLGGGVVGLTTAMLLVRQGHDVTVFERIQPKCAKTIFHGFVLAVWGRLRRTGVRGVSIIAEHVWDIAVLSNARKEGRLPEAMAGAAGPGPTPAPVRKLWHASGGSAGW